MITIRFYLDDSPRSTVRCPVGSPIPRIGETVELSDDLLYEVQSVAYDFSSDGSAPEVTVGIDHF